MGVEMGFHDGGRKQSCPLTRVSVTCRAPNVYLTKPEKGGSKITPLLMLNIINVLAKCYQIRFFSTVFCLIEGKY